MFKVSSLRNIGKIDPNPHDGKTKDLTTAAVKIVVEDHSIRQSLTQSQQQGILKHTNDQKGPAYTYA